MNFKGSGVPKQILEMYFDTIARWRAIPALVVAVPVRRGESAGKNLKCSEQLKNYRLIYGQI